MSDASKFKDSEGQVVNVKDAQARTDIATINASLANLYYYSNSTKLDSHSIDVATAVTYNVLPTHNGWLAVTFTTNASNIEFFARIRQGYVGDFFQGVAPSYHAGETFLMIPCQANRYYSVEVKRANTTGALTIDTYELY